jgi:hypothetical protein
MSIEEDREIVGRVLAGDKAAFGARSSATGRMP